MDKVIHFPGQPEKRRDDERAKLIQPYLDRLYAHFALYGTKYIRFEGSDDITLGIQFSGIDSCLVCRQSHRLRYIEEKTDFHLPYRFCIETVSNTRSHPPIPGWGETSLADRLVYCFVWLLDDLNKHILDVSVIDFERFREYFWIDENYLNFREHIMKGTQNETASRLVPVMDAAVHVPMNRYLITNNGNILPVPFSGQNPITIAKRVLTAKGIPFHVIGKGELA